MNVLFEVHQVIIFPILFPVIFFDHGLLSCFINGSLDFFSAVLTARNSPELKIHIRNVSQDTSVYLLLCGQLTLTLNSTLVSSLMFVLGLVCSYLPFFLGYR